jgi:hypothetical protein
MENATDPSNGALEPPAKRPRSDDTKPAAEPNKTDREDQWRKGFAPIKPE